MEQTTVGIYPQAVASFDRELETSRCDRCGASARVLIAGPGGQLAFCGHHWHAFEDRLTAGGWRVLASSIEDLAS